MDFRQPNAGNYYIGNQMGNQNPANQLRNAFTNSMPSSMDISRTVPSNMLPHYEIITVNGENGARALQMAPNSKTFAADETKPDRIWLAMTDGAGYLTVRPIKAEFEDVITQQTIQETLASINERLMRLEEKYNDEQLNSRSNKPRNGRSNNAELAEP